MGVFVFHAQVTSISSDLSEVVAKVQGYSDSGPQATQPGKVERSLEPNSPDVQCRAFPMSLCCLPREQGSNEMKEQDSL